MGFEMKVVCFDFDDVIGNKNTLRKFLGLYSKKTTELEYMLKLLEDNKHPKKFFKDVTEGAKLFKGIPYEYVKKISNVIGINKNVKITLKKIKSMGYKIVIISTTDEGMIRRFLEKNGIGKYIDHIYAAKVGVKNGFLTGTIKGGVIRTEKTGVVKKVEHLYKTKKKDITYIGDGMTDLPIMKCVSKGILFNPNAITIAEVMTDKKLIKMKDENRLFIVKDKDMSKILEFID
ncbi:HAD-IB family phosphatase [archaeon]|nr:HAD-IB family phosphatase [archaeon]